MDYQNQHQYDDILNLPHPTSKNHPRMSLHDRAAQFSPFAALTGHEAAIKETARLTDDKQILSEDVYKRQHKNYAEVELLWAMTNAIELFRKDFYRKGGDVYKRQPVQ